MVNKEHFVFYESFFKSIERIEKRIGKEEAYDFLKDIIKFGLYGEVPDDDSASWLYGFDQTITSISAAQDRYEAAIANGKKGGRKKTIDDNKVLELKAQGFTNKAVADELGCSESSVEKIIAKNRKNQKNLNINNNINTNSNSSGIFEAPPQKPGADDDAPFRF